MTFQYGSQQFEVTNPFRVEGWIIAGRGAVTALLGLILALGIRDHIASLTSGSVPNPGAAALGWLQLGVAFSLFVGGLWALGWGLFRSFRFYVGRGVPADLAPGASAQGDAGYDVATLADMLKARKNPSFREPRGLIARALFTLVPGLIFLPFPMRTVLLRVTAAQLFALWALVLYGLALFSGQSGLTQVTGTPVADWLTLGLAGWLVAIWAAARPRASDMRRASDGVSGVTGLALTTFAAILAPALLLQLHAYRPLPAVPVDLSAVPVIVTVLGLAVTGLTMALTWTRAGLAAPLTEVSEFKDHWQEALHPRDIFRAFETAMADRRWLEIPNRNYLDIDAALVVEGGRDRGAFEGATLLETQPAPTALPLPPATGPLRLAATLFAQGLLLLAALVLFLKLRGLGTLEPQALSDVFVWPTVLGIFGAVLAGVATVHWAEIPFVSHLVYFWGEGTYSESRVSTGMSVYDSNRSENTVVRASMTPWLLVSRVLSSTFAISGPGNLDQRRMVLDMRRDPAFLQGLSADLRRFLDSRQNIAEVRSSADLNQVGQMHQLNQATRSGPALAGAPPQRDTLPRPGTASLAAPQGRPLPDDEATVAGRPGQGFDGRYILRVTAGADAGQTVSLPFGAATIGRGSTATLVIQDERASRSHAELTFDGEKFLARDRQSRNGTLLNGQPLTEAPMTLGDVLTIGDTELVLTCEGLELEGTDAAAARAAYQALLAREPRAADARRRLSALEGGRPVPVVR